MAREGVPVVSLDQADQDRSARALARVERWALKSEAARILVGDEWRRVQRCHRYAVIPKGETVHTAEVDLWRSELRGSARFGKVETCASVWACPVCSAKISERRRDELLQAVEAHKARGGAVALLTVTFRHGAGDDLADILARFLDAYRRMTSWRGYKAWSARAGVTGYVRALEVTHGAHGWHPHGHTLLFLERPQDLARLEGELYLLWARAVEVAGLPGTSFKAFKLHDGEQAAKYVAKFGTGRAWTLADELTKGQSKRGRQGSRTPWDLLRASLHDGDEKAAGLFRVYAQAFKGRSQLTWSRGLRDRLGLEEELTDEQAEAQLEADAGWSVLASVDLATWRRVTWSRTWGQLLELVADGDLGRVMEFLAALPESGRRRERGGPDDPGVQAVG